jgi:hypothetical protein
MSQAALDALANAITADPLVAPSGTGQSVTMRLRPDLSALRLTVPTGIVPVDARVAWTVASEHRKVAESQNEASFILAPDVVSTLPVSADEERVITATVTLTASAPAPVGTITSVRSLSERVRTPVLLLPSVLVLCNHKLFEVRQRGGVDPCALIVVPTDAVYANVDALLSRIDTMLVALNGLNPHFASLPKIGSLTNTLSALQTLTAGVVAFRGGRQAGATPHLVLAVADPLSQGQGIANLERSVKFFFGQTGEDTFSSGMLVGLGVKAQFFNTRDNRHTDGVCEVGVPTGSVAVRISTLHAVPPETEPAGCARTLTAPRPGETFGDRMSSLLFPVA